MSATLDLTKFVEARRRDVDAALDRFLTGPPACPLIVSEAMRYSLFAGGKRLRPILTLAAAEAVAQHMGHDPAEAPPGPLSLALPAACAVEMIHTYSLIHDDLPAMDDDAIRRGRPTSHVVFGEGIAILAGDALLTEAFRLLATEPRDGGDVPSRKLRVIALVGTAAGAEGMVGGQAIDLQACGTGRAGHDTTVTGMNAEALQAMHARKTGALIRAAATAGAIMAGGSDGIVAATDRYANELGLAFQIVDDILDVEGAAEEIGKTVGKDAAAGKPTYPALHGLERSRRLAAECIDRARTILTDAGLAGHLPALAGWVVERNK